LESKIAKQELADARQQKQIDALAAAVQKIDEQSTGFREN
jgi:hypothetical protein